MSGLRIGSLFSGYEGLGMAVQSVMGGEIAWVSDIDPGACKILAHRYPDVPNLGDITTVDWSAVEPVDVLTGGFPCQDVSSAGKRAGLNNETRSGLWAQMARAIDEMRPPLVVAENVRGLLSACALSELEPCPRCLGDESQPHRPVLRALGRVLGDLAELGYDARWGGLRAADVGAPHGRFRVFVVAWPAGSAADPFGSIGRRDESGSVGPEAPARTVREAGRGTGRGDRSRGSENKTCREIGHAWIGPRCGWCGAWRDDTAADTYGVAVREQPVALPGRRGTTVAGLLSSDAAAVPHGRGLGTDIADLRAGEPDADRGAATHADGAGLGGLEELHAAQEAGHGAGYRHDTDGLAVAARGVDWGAYTAAVRRWERLTRPAPNPTERGKNGQPRLSPAFVEWMQGLPAGWVTDVPGLSRNEMLKALGNGVVPQQAAQALRLLLPHEARAVA